MDSPTNSSSSVRVFTRFFDVILMRRIRPRRVPTGIELVRLEKQMKDFVGGSMALIPQRQMMFLSAVLLTSYFYDMRLAVICFLLCEITELGDYVLSRRILAWDGKKGIKAVQYHRLIMLSSVCSSLAVGFFVLSTSQIEGPTLHFTPLFFLFAAGLFAAVNNHQIQNVLFVRLAIYGCVFLYIPAKDIWQTSPPLHSVLWLQMLTVVFVLYFVIDCSFIFLRLYKKGLDQLYELRVERDRAKAAYEVKSQFVSVVSHELRTPLTSIIFALDLLKKGTLAHDPARTAEVLEIAHKNSNHLSSLINDLLDLQKLESGQMRYGFTEVDIGELVHSSVDAISGMAESVPVTLTIEPMTERLHVKGDETKLQQVLSNLLSNAIKFSHANETVKVNIKRRGDVARVTITDKGVGIPEYSREKVFGKFGQVDSSDHRSFSGSGLGLSISEQIMTAHNGLVDYNSVLGQGAAFYFELPLFEVSTLEAS